MVFDKMTEDQIACIDSLSDAIKSIQSYLQCTICLEMISVPMKTRCGHTFCRSCIAAVLNKRNSKCPLCNSNLQRRSISKDQHTEKCIQNFEQLVQAVRADTNIDILWYKKNPHNTRESCPTPKIRRRSAPSANDTRSRRTSSEKISSFFTMRTQEEQSAGSSNRDILKETRATCAEYKKDNAIKKDDSAERRYEGKEPSTEGLSGVYPLVCSPRKRDSLNDEVIFTKDEKVESWLETLPATELLENPPASPEQQQVPSCLDDTATVVSGISLLSSISTVKEKGVEGKTSERLTKRDNVPEQRASDTMKGQRASRASSRGGNNTRGRNKRRATRSFPEREIKVDSTERKLKYEGIHAKIRERSAVMETSAKSSGDSLISSTDAADSSKHLAGPGNTTKETWNRVVQFGKEMRTKRSKLKSLDVSIQSTSGSRFSDEHSSNKRTNKQKVSPTNMQIRSTMVNDLEKDDAIINPDESNLAEKENLTKYRKSPETSFGSKNEQKTLQNTSHISLEQEGRVAITNLRREQMDDIIGVTSNNQTNTTDNQETKGNPSEDHGTVPKKRLSLRKHSESSRNSELSPPQITPVKVNLEERYDVLRGSPPLLSPRNDQSTPVRDCDNSRKTESVSRLSLKKNSRSNEKLKEPFAAYDASQLSNVKCNLMKQMDRSETEKRRIVVPNASTLSKIDPNREKNAREEKTFERNRTNLETPSSTGKTCVVLFSKLGKVFRKRRKVKFYKLGTLRRESTTSTLSASILNVSRANVITFVMSEDTLETSSRTSEEECNLKSGISSCSANRVGLVEVEEENAGAKRRSKDSSDGLAVSAIERVKENVRSDGCGTPRDNSDTQRRNKFDFEESSKRTQTVSTTEKEIRVLERKESRSKPIVTSVVRLMAPEEDSQLRFFNLGNSEPNRVVERVKTDRETRSDGNSAGKLGTNLTVHQDIAGTNNHRKRKRLDGNVDKIKTDNVRSIAKDDGRKTKNDNTGFTESLDIVTQITRLQEDVDKLVKARRIANDPVISLSLEEDNVEGRRTNDLNESKKKYKRIHMLTSSSDTDTDTSPTVKESNKAGERKNEKNVSVVKRKRVPSDNSDDDDTVVNEIVNNWCNGLNTSGRSSKKGKLEETKIVTITSNRTCVDPPESMEFDSWNNVVTPVKRRQEKNIEDRSNNDIIDKVRLIRMNENEGLTDKRRMDEPIGDHFDDDIVGVMTESLGTHFFTNENPLVDSKPVEKELVKKEVNRSTLMSSSYVETNDLFAETNRSKPEENLEDFEETLIENLNSSNKENDVKEGNARYFRNNGKRDISCSELTNERRIDKTSESKGTSNVRKYEETRSKNVEEPKETISSEYDSLMDVTQDQLLLKALEEDLFGAANFRPSSEKSTTAKRPEEKRRLEDESRTPRKVEKTNFGNKDAESTSDEDDIIENTPQSQKKYMEIDHSNESRAKKSLSMSQTTPVSKRNFKAPTTMTPSTIVGKLKTPIDQNKFRPLYQSTPKIIQASSNREKELAKFIEERKKSVVESIPGRKERSMTTTKSTSTTQVKGESMENANRCHDKRRLCFVWSSLAVAQVESVKKLAVLFGATTTQNFTPAVSHVIVCTQEENNAATKTLKFLQGIAYRKFVVGFKWVVDSLKEGKLLDEEPYEAVDCYTLEAGPRNSRLRQTDLFEKFAFLCIEPFLNITVTQCQDLLKAIGATIVRTIDELAAIKNKHKVILLQSEAHKDEVVADWYTKTSAIPVACEWIVECISQYKLVSCYTFLHEIVPEDVLKSGYPEEMIDPEEFDSTCDTSPGH